MQNTSDPLDLDFQVRRTAPHNTFVYRLSDSIAKYFFRRCKGYKKTPLLFLKSLMM